LNQFAARRRRPRGGVRPRLALASGSSICQRLRRQRDRARHAVSASVTATPAFVEVGPNLVDDIVISRCLRRQHQPEWQHPNPEERENAEEGSGNEQHARHQPDPPERRPAQPKDYSLHTARPPVDHPPEQPLATLRRGLARRGSGIGGLGAVQSLAENKKRLRQFKRRLHPGGLAPLLR